jgi:hypothetical protein
VLAPQAGHLLGPALPAGRRDKLRPRKYRRCVGLGLERLGQGSGRLRLAGWLVAHPAAAIGKRANQVASSAQSPERKALSATKVPTNTAQPGE